MKEIIFLNKLDLKEKNSYSLDFDNCNIEEFYELLSDTDLILASPQMDLRL